jgi:DNA ligase (NAD+)
VPEIGPEIAATVAEWFDEEENAALIEKLRAAGVRLADDVAETDGGPKPLEGLSVVITGTLPTLAREEATALAQDAGARVVSSVSKKTSFVVLGENPGSKLAKAEELGVETIDEDAFLARIGKGRG